MLQQKIEEAKLHANHSDIEELVQWLHFYEDLTRIHYPKQDDPRDTITSEAEGDDRLELNNKNNQVSVGIRNHIFGTIFYKFHTKINRFRHNFVIFHDFFPDI